MKHLTLTSILQILFTTIIYRLDLTNGEINRRWVEIDNRLFLIEPDGLYTWEQAAHECKKEHTDLIHPESNYDYTKLKDAIKQNFRNYSSFWTSNKIKFTTIFDHLGLGKSKENRKKCKKFDNSNAFKFMPDDCESSFGFICERQLLKGFSVFKDNEKEYLIQPAKEFTCEETYNQCSKYRMSSILFNDYANNRMLREYIFFNYGSNPQFWFNLNNETHLNCVAFKKVKNLNTHTKLGFICERNILKTTLTTRHLVFIIFLSIAAIGAIFVYVIGHCCFFKKEDNFLMDHEDPIDVKVTDIK